MIQSKFIKISQELKGAYQCQQVKHHQHGYSILPVTKHILRLNYNNTTIHILYELGRLNIANVSAIVAPHEQKENFDIETSNHLKRFFSKKKPPWIIRSKDALLCKNLDDFLSQSNLTSMAKKTLFEPKIEGRMNENSYNILSHFHLEFSKKEESILPIINFYKLMIDSIKINKK